jgi:pimeloyl-ACP methyl ester carboxylesterase
MMRPMSHRGPISRRLALALAVAAAGSLAAVPSIASAAVPVRFERIAGVPSAGTPAKYDKVGILEVGSRRAKNILVLNPGTSASAAYFAPLARTIAAKAKGWQVWAVERRENLLEDQSMLDKGKARTATPRQVFDYYLGYLADPAVKTHFRMIPDAQVAYARRWGMAVEIGDLRRVVQLAQQRGRKVVVGGHSLGGTITTAYATWDFHGEPGAKGLAGLVLIDGASRTEPVTADAARASLAQLDANSPWLSFGGITAPFAGLFNSSGALGVELDPDGPSLGQQFRFLPANLKPSVPVTNAGQYGYSLDTATSPAALAAAQAHLGHLATSGDPRGWVSDELTPLKRFADMFSGWGLKGLDGTAWYHPMRLTLDAGAVANGLANPAQDVLDVDATHGRDLPKSLRIYAFAAALGGTRVLDAARALAAQSRIPASRLTLVDRHTTYAHNDPNSAAPRNAFVSRLIPFLKQAARG